MHRLPSPEPIQVIVEQSGASVWSDWGPLVGVVVGAILAAGGQMLAAKQQRAHERDRGLVEVRRVLYGRVVEQLSTLESAAIELNANVKTGDATDKPLARLDTALDALHVLHGEVAISGTPDVYIAVNAAFVVGARSGDGPDRWERIAEGTRLVRILVLDAMRNDLHVPGEAIADHTRTEVLQQLADLRKGRGGKS